MHTRGPEPAEARDPDWRPIDAAEHAALLEAERDAVIRLISSAFADLQREDGVGLRETWILDSRDAERALRMYWGQFCPPT
jgi:hypothetical protein